MAYAVNQANESFLLSFLKNGHSQAPSLSTSVSFVSQSLYQYATREPRLSISWEFVRGKGLPFLFARIFKRLGPASADTVMAMLQMLSEVVGPEELFAITCADRVTGI